MSIRWKLLLLLLGIALVPVAILALINRNGMQKLGADLAERGRKIVTERTAEQLRQLIRDQAKSLRFLRHSLENTLQLQAREARARLPPPRSFPRTSAATTQRRREPSRRIGTFALPRAPRARRSRSPTNSRSTSSRRKSRPAKSAVKSPAWDRCPRPIRPFIKDMPG